MLPLLRSACPTLLSYCGDEDDEDDDDADGRDDGGGDDDGGDDDADADIYHMMQFCHEKASLPPGNLL